jgi:hypothetical protein
MYIEYLHDIKGTLKIAMNQLSCTKKCLERTGVMLISPIFYFPTLYMSVTF